MITLEQEQALEYISNNLNDRLIEGEIISALKKGSYFSLNSRIYTVNCNAEKTIQIKDSQGHVYTWSKYGRSIFPNGTRRLNKAATLSRDISGIVMLDLINRNNPLHKLHKLTLLLITQVIEKNLIEKPKN